MKIKPNKLYLARLQLCLYVCLCFVVLYYCHNTDIPGLIYLLLTPFFLVALYGFIYYLFCWLFIAYRPRDETWWKRIDYVWLFFASLALIGQTQSVREMWFQSPYEMAQASKAGIDKSLRAEINDMLDPAQCATATSRYEAADALQVASLCQRYADVARPLSDVALVNLLQELPALGSEYSAEPIQRWLAGLQETLKERELRRTEVVKYQNLIRETEFEELFRYFAPLLVVIALALRASKVSGELYLKAPKQRKFWLIINQRVVVDSLGFSDVAHKRFAQALGSWRKAEWGVVHMACDFIAQSSQRGSNEPVLPGRFESEFQLASVEEFETSGFVQWAAGQSMELLYLVGETDPELIRRLRQWGEATNTEVLVREHI